MFEEKNHDNGNGTINLCLNTKKFSHFFFNNETSFMFRQCDCSHCYDRIVFGMEMIMKKWNRNRQNKKKTGPKKKFQIQSTDDF